ncbi:MAG: aminopeptidase P family protein [Gammaproteobacteria bacterium]|nr:aminopeptidase P family protein [Gammaproteobacteria bacterium]
MNVPAGSRIAKLRATMARHGVAAVVVPTADPHLSEYLPARWQSRAYLSGFTGSAGTLIVTGEHAGLWTDSRYFSQAERQLEGTGIELMRLRVAHGPEHLDWLRRHLRTGQTVAIAGDCLSLAARRQLEEAARSAGATLRVDLDLPGEIWADRPALPDAPIRAHPQRYAGATRAEKLARIRAAMRGHGATHHLLSSLDDIAWSTNLRGRDVECNPVFLGHLLISTAGGATLFVDPAKIDASLAADLAADGIELAAYEAVARALAALGTGDALLFDASRVVVAVIAGLPATVRIVEGANPSTTFKAVKSADELGHVREAMRQDGAALVRAFRRLEQRLSDGTATSELTVDELLREERSAAADWVGESFTTIAGYQANGALPHYRATPESHARLRTEGLLLVDSGGQYLGGTTDVTRVLALGEVSAEQRRDSALVLKGLIALSRARFPKGASGPQLDALARAPLWAAGCDYGHGTGHGVGYFLNVHEGPQGIRPPAAGAALVALEPGMISSIEPGLYKPERYGIRHENLVVVVEAERTEFGEFLAFDVLTLCPFDRRTFDAGLLDEVERAWVDAYHRRVYGALAPLLQGADLDWLRRHCAPLN